MSDLDELRIKVKSHLCDVLVDSLFCEGLSQIVYEGINYQGLNEMTDKELLQELEMCFDDDDELVNQFRVSISVNKLI